MRLQRTYFLKHLCEHAIDMCCFLFNHLLPHLVVLKLTLHIFHLLWVFLLAVRHKKTVALGAYGATATARDVGVTTLRPASFLNFTRADLSHVVLLWTLCILLFLVPTNLLHQFFCLLEWLLSLIPWLVAHRRQIANNEAIELFIRLFTFFFCDECTKLLVLFQPLQA